MATRTARRVLTRIAAMEDEIAEDPDEASALSAAMMDAVSPPSVRALTRRLRSGEATFEHPTRSSELTLQAFVIPGQMILADFARKVAVKGTNERFTITVTELAKDKSVVKTFVCSNCLLTSLDFPTLSAKGNELPYETATFKPEKVTIIKQATTTKK